MLLETQAWMHRVHFFKVSYAVLGFPGELWDPNPEHYQGWEEQHDRLVADGRKETGRALAYELASLLLDDLIVAAGGVEASIMRLRDVVSRAKEAIAAWRIAVEPGVPNGFADIATMEAWYTSLIYSSGGGRFRSGWSELAVVATSKTSKAYCLPSNRYACKRA